MVELWRDEAPSDLCRTHESVLAIGSAGLEVGDGEGHHVVVDLPRGYVPLEIYADSRTPSQVSRVVFVIRSNPYPDGGVPADVSGLARACSVIGVSNVSA
jgi:hypothetical protein